MSLTYYNGVIFTTVATANYLPRAMVMAKSVKRWMPEGKVILCLVEEKIPEAVKKLHDPFDDVILAKNLGFSNFYRFIFQYSRFEGANACKAQLLIYLLKTFQNHDYFIFLDSDTKVFGPFDELTEKLTVNEIMISPHFISFNKKNPFYYLRIVQKSGIFNTGFFAIKRGNESKRFLGWWANILLKYCYQDTNKGVWNEQKWLDLALGLFGFHILTDPGYNMGPWNFGERELTFTDKGEYKANGKPLRFFHFSGFLSNYFKKRLEKADPSQRKLIEKIADEYRQDLIKADQDQFGKIPWSYERFWGGSLIEKKSRLIFRNNPQLFKDLDNPFSKGNQFFIEQHHKKQKPGKS
ncbi:MAG: hypothetical protein ACM3YE_16045 [Bacteroidota bacterium]